MTGAIRRLCPTAVGDRIEIVDLYAEVHHRPLLARRRDDQ
jgi:hypothetical protein